MKKKIVRLLLWALGLFLLSLAIFAAVLYTNRDKIKAAVLNEANALLSEPVDVSKVDVSINKFPYASLLFSNVYCKGAQASTGDTLIYAREMYFEFDLWNVFSDDLKIKHISFVDGTLHILRPANGKPNYEIWKSDTSKSSSSVFTLEQVSLNNFKTIYKEDKVDLYTKGHVNSMTLRGSFSSGNFNLSTEADLFVEQLTYQDSTYVYKLNARPYFTLKNKPSDESNSIHITEGLLKLPQQDISFEVDINNEGTDVRASTQKTDLAQLLELAAEQGWYSTDLFKATGKGSISFNGHFSDAKSPELSIAFTTENASVSNAQGSSISNLNTEGKYSISNKIDHLQLSQFSGSGKTGNISGTLRIDDFKRPSIVLDLKSDLDLEEWLVFAPVDTITQPSGKAIVDLHFENRFRSLDNIRPDELKQAKASGSLELQNISFAFKDANKKIENMNGALAFAGNDLRVKSFYFKTGRSDIFLEGTFENVLNFIYFKNQRLRVDTRVRSQELVMEDFLLEGASSKDDDDYNISFVNNLDLDLDLKVDKFLFEKFYATDISGQLTVKNGVIKGHQINLKANDGSYAGDFTIDARNETKYLLAANLSGNSIDIHKLFNSFNNFGQTVIVADNIYGTANLNVQYFSKMSPSLEIDVASIEMTSNLQISNGNLKNYDPLMALSDFADIQELKDVHFATLENNIGIKNSRISIPKMNIVSNVLDMGIEGSHGFDNTIDYAIRMKLSDVLFNSRRKKKKRSEFDDHLSVMDNQDDPNIFLKMTGSVDNPHIAIDRKNMGESINSDFKQQGQELKNIFKKEDKTEQKKEDSGIQFDLFGEDKNKEK